MNSVLDHYETHLAPVYVWMAGGVEHALSLGSNDVAPFLDPPGIAVDLGAGFGMHSIPLARAGHQVLAVDTSRLLLAELRRHSEGLDVTAIEADLLASGQSVDRRPVRGAHISIRPPPAAGSGDRRPRAPPSSPRRWR